MMMYPAAVATCLLGLSFPDHQTSAFRWALPRSCDHHIRIAGTVQRRPMNLEAYRQAYQYQLDLMTEGVTLNGEEVEVESVVEQMDKDLEEANSQEAAANTKVDMLQQRMDTLQAEHDIEIGKLKEGMAPHHQDLVEASAAARSAESTLQNLQMELRLKEDEKRSVLSQMEEEMRKKERELREQKAEFGTESTYLRIQANQEKMAAIQEYKKRERDLHGEVETLHHQLEEERAQALKASAAVQEVKDRMKKQEEQMKQQMNEIGNDFTHMKIEVHQEQMALIEDYKHREEDLMKQIEAVRISLEAEREKANVAKDLSNQITRKRVEIDGELNAMRRKYEEEKETHALHNKWYQEEIDALKEQMIDVETLKLEIEALKAERAINDGMANGANSSKQTKGTALFEPYHAQLSEHFGTDKITKDMIVVELRMWNQPVSGVKWEVAKRLCEFLEREASVEA